MDIFPRFSRGLEASQISYNAAVSACERGEEWQQALELLRRAQERRLGDVVSDLDAVLENSVERKMLLMYLM